MRHGLSAVKFVSTGLAAALIIVSLTACSFEGQRSLNATPTPERVTPTKESNGSNGGPDSEQDKDDDSETLLDCISYQNALTTAGGNWSVFLGNELTRFRASAPTTFNSPEFRDVFRVFESGIKPGDISANWNGLLSNLQLSCLEAGFDLRID